MKVVDAWREFSNEVEQRLKEQQRKGYTGWDGSYPTESLQNEIMADGCDLIRGTGSKKKCVDIAARSMMLHKRIDA